MSLDRLGLGTNLLRSDQLDAGFAVLDAWRAAGGRLIDTAASYGGGESERVIGAWLRSRGVRADMTILTKAGHPGDDYRRSRVSPTVIASDLDASLERLGVASVDIFLIHRDDPTLPVGVILDALAAEVAAGRAGSYGVSNWTLPRLDEALAYVDAHRLPSLGWSSSYLGLADPIGEAWPGTVSAADEASRAWYASHAVRLLSWSPVANGFFRADADLSEARFDAYRSPDNLARRERVAELGHRRGLTTTQVALAWVLNQPVAPVASIGTRSVDHLAEAVAAAAIELSAADLHWLEHGGAAWTP